ncbi:MAG: scavenger receptor cysteine-rich domain-containing protein, partial [Endozoicomonadaceae bacterium]|nr:scavenger receptor cysteine-rich domain-containing protein [Endozoicomonadaceae bacterium]
MKQLFFCCVYSVFFVFIVATTNAASESNQSNGSHLTFLNFLEQHQDLPVEYLSAIYMADTNLQNELLEGTSHPVFSVLKAKKKNSLTRKPVHPSSADIDLNDLISPLKGAEYINQNRMFPLTQVPLFSWLLKEYGPCDYSGESGTTYLLSITIGGMLYDLKCRAENDAIARLVLEFLSQPYIKDIHSRSADHPWFTRCGQYLSKFFFPKKTELSFSEKMASLGGSPYTEEQGRNKRLITLKEKGYSYKKDYDFISCEPGENGKERSVSFDEVVLPTKKTEKLIYADYPVLKGSCDKSAIKTGMKAVTLFTAGLSLFPAASALIPSTPPSSQCEVNNVCNPYNSYKLFEAGFAKNLQRNPKGCFTLGSDVTLNRFHNIPVFRNCDTPFSGTFDPGRYTLKTENKALSIFGCIDQATITGRFDFCTDTDTYTPPLIAEKVLNGSVINVQQIESCTIQRPVFGDIAGDNNQINFSGESKEIRVRHDTGIIATQVSGNNNMIAARQAQTHGSPIVSTAGGYNNTYHQQHMNITRVTGRNPHDNKLLTARKFAGSGTNIIQNNITATFFTNNTNTSNQGISNAQNEVAGIFSSKLDITFKSLHLQNEIRLTNISDNSEQRTAVVNHGRFEIFKDNYWRSVCEDTFYQRTAHAACKALGFREAESEGARLSLKSRLSATKLTFLPIHLKKRCTGYERDLNDCQTESNTRACPENSEAFLSCSYNDTAPARDTSANLYLRLTDYTSNHPERFDTTNSGTGRLELFISSVSEWSTFCSLDFSAQAINNACNSMGFDGGEQINPVSVVSLGDGIPQYRIRSLSTPESGLRVLFNLYTGSCTRDDDVILKCNPKIVPGWNIRLTSRYSNDSSRANLSSTGFGRLEIYNRGGLIKGFLALRPENILNNGATVACERLGFNHGRLSHLTAGSTISIDIHYLIPALRNSRINKKEFILDCKSTTDSLESCLKQRDVMDTPVTNAVLLCTKSAEKNIQVLPKPVLLKPCLISNRNTNAVFSGSYDVADDCMTVQCPVMLWDINSV